MRRKRNEMYLMQTVKGSHIVPREHGEISKDANLLGCVGFSSNYFSTEIVRILLEADSEKKCPEGELIPEFAEQLLDNIGEDIIRSRIDQLSAVFSDVATMPIYDKSTIKFKQRNERGKTCRRPCRTLRRVRVLCATAAQLLQKGAKKFRHDAAASDVFVKQHGVHYVKNIGEAIYTIISDDKLSDTHTREKCGSEISLWLRGPSGSYKDLLLQLIYLLVYKKKNHLAFYIDLSKYEFGADVDTLESDLQNMKRILKRETAAGSEDNNAKIKARPLIFLDNVREFNCGINGHNGVYETINKTLKECGAIRLVLGTDHVTSLAKMQVPVFLELFKNEAEEENNIKELLKFEKESGRIKNVINITSMNLSRVRESKKFVRNCLEFIEHQAANEELSSKIIDKLNALEFYTIDAQLLIKLLLNSNFAYTLPKNVVYLYDDLLLTSNQTGLQNHEWEDLAQLSYRLEYDSDKHIDVHKLHGARWKCVREHRSITEYLIARHYVDRLRKVICGGQLSDVGAEHLNVVFPKSINRFIMHLLTDNDLLNLNIFVNSNMDALVYYENFLCQITYIFGAHKDDNAFGLVATLKIICERVEERYAELKEYYDEDVPTVRRAYLRNHAFVIRCIMMGLGRLGRDAEFIGYINDLVPTDGFSGYSGESQEISDDVNRAFHLDYYGDTSIGLHASSGFGNYTDNKLKGINTMRKLLSDLSKKKNCYDQLGVGDRNIFFLQLYTYCRLLQVREFHITKDVRFALDTLLSFAIIKGKEMLPAINITPLVGYLTYIKDGLKSDEGVTE